MTLTTLLIRIGIAALILTALMAFGIIKTRRVTESRNDNYDSDLEKSNASFMKPMNLLMSLMQNFCGVLFLFSGSVSAFIGVCNWIFSFYDCFRNRSWTDAYHGHER